MAARQSTQPQKAQYQQDDHDKSDNIDDPVHGLSACLMFGIGHYLKATLMRSDSAQHGSVFGSGALENLPVGETRRRDVTFVRVARR